MDEGFVTRGSQDPDCISPGAGTRRLLSLFVTVFTAWLRRVTISHLCLPLEELGEETRMRCCSH